MSNALVRGFAHSRCSPESIYSDATRPCCDQVRRKYQNRCEVKHQCLEDTWNDMLESRKEAARENPGACCGPTHDLMLGGLKVRIFVFGSPSPSMSGILSVCSALELFERMTRGVCKAGIYIFSGQAARGERPAGRSKTPAVKRSERVQH
ncbi:hypothetical protein JOB18_035850 [Solea senegalensis]|uniref:Uncharacterized protein n=1 Tax=Solea senegalensis TaxID=28829 RepID=A0AAV6T0P0_SOLSE|nr:hypothetical protein JOB18_035850 [Solea senegalensis]